MDLHIWEVILCISLCGIECLYLQVAYVIKWYVLFNSVVSHMSEFDGNENLPQTKVTLTLYRGMLQLKENDILYLLIIPCFGNAILWLSAEFLWQAKVINRVISL